MHSGHPLQPPREDERLSDLWDAVGRARGARWRFVLTHPRLTFAAARARLRLPTLPAWPSRTRDGDHLANVMEQRRSVLGKPFVRTCASVLPVPQDAATYTAGTRRATLRRKLHAAEAHGIAVHEVVLPAERRELLRVTQDRDRNQLDERRRKATTDDTDMLDLALWLVACDAHHDPKALAVIAEDAPWAAIRYFRPLGDGEDHALARWTLAEAMVTALAPRGVTQLLDDSHPGDIAPGARAFHRLVGFRYARLRPAPPPAVAVRKHNRRQVGLLAAACGGLVAAILGVPASASHGPGVASAGVRPSLETWLAAVLPPAHQAALHSLGIAPEFPLVNQHSPGQAAPAGPRRGGPVGESVNADDEPYGSRSDVPQPAAPDNELAPSPPKTPPPPPSAPPPSAPPVPNVQVPDVPVPEAPDLPDPEELPSQPLRAPAPQPQEEPSELQPRIDGVLDALPDAAEDEE